MNIPQEIGQYSKTAIRRFWKLVDKRASGECWEWKGRRQNKGYGVFGDYTKHTVLAHRFSAHLKYGAINGLVLHKCDNPACVNPGHLFTGTQQENMTDCYNKRRVGVFSKPNSYAHIKNTLERAKLVREAQGTQGSIAARFGISQATVSRIKRREIWQD